jgi:hypothetical protein
MHKEGRSLRATHLPSPPPPARPPASQGARGAAKPRITWRRGRCPVRSARWKPLRRGSRAPCCLDPGRGEQTGIPPRLAFLVLSSQTPRESGPCLPHLAQGRVRCHLGFWRHRGDFRTAGLWGRLGSFAKGPPEALDLRETGIAFYPGSMGRRGRKTEVKERGFRWLWMVLQQKKAVLR